MTHEIRVTIELLDSQIVREPITTKVVLIGLEGHEMEDGGLGNIETAIDTMLWAHRPVEEDIDHGSEALSFMTTALEDNPLTQYATDGLKRY